jgi:hypothetical protein
MIMILLAIVASLFLPFTIFGLVATKPLVLLFGVFMIARRLLRWLLGGRGPIRSRRRRWPW